MFQKLNELNKLKQEYFDKIKAEAKVAVKESLKDFFSLHSNISSIRWTQYTPYFNDGDPCEFSVHEPYIGFKEGADGDAGDYGDGRFSLWDLRKDSYSREKGYLKVPYEEKLEEDFKELTRLLRDNEDALQYAFGDHVEVIVTPENIEVNEYDHD